MFIEFKTLGEGEKEGVNVLININHIVSLNLDKKANDCSFILMISGQFYYLDMTYEEAKKKILSNQFEPVYRASREELGCIDGAMSEGAKNYIKGECVEHGPNYGENKLSHTDPSNILGDFTQK